MSDATAKTPRAAAPIAPYMALTGIWLLTITIVPPRGDFPLNDDWMYAKVVQHLVETGEYQATPYADPTFILQAYWGAAFVNLFGFSFETLRVSTLVLGLVAVWAAHWAAREAGLSVRWAFLVALTLLVNPLFLNLSYTFMTDVPFLAFTILSIAAFLRAWRTARVRWIAIASTIAAAGFFIRQFTLLVPVAFGATLAALYIRDLITKSPLAPKGRPKVAQGKASTASDALGTIAKTNREPCRGDLKLTPIAIAALIMPWITAYVLLPILPIGGEGLGTWNWDDLGHTLARRAVSILKFSTIATAYLGLFIAPIIVGIKLKKDDRHGDKYFRFFFPLSTFFVVLAAQMVIDHLLRVPNMGNVLYDTGVGPLLLPGMVEGNRIAAPLHIRQLWLAATAAGLSMAAFAIWIALVTHVQFPIRHRENFKKISTADFFLALLAGAFVIVLILPAVQARFDRYLLSAQVPVAIVCANAISEFTRRDPAKVPAYISVGILYLFSILSLQDYLAWNSARWRAVAALQQNHAAPLEQINGGYEFNGWFHSDAYAEESRRTGKKIFGPQGWWIRGDEFRVSLRPNKHFEVIGTEPYFSWLGWERREILLLKRTEPDTNSALFD